MVDVVYGTNYYLVREAIQSLEKKYSDAQEFVRFSSSDRLFDLSLVVEACRTISLFSTRKCVSLLIDQDKDLAKLDEGVLIDLIEQPNPDVNLIIWFSKKPLAKTKLKKSIDRFAKLHDVKSLSANEYENRLNQAIKHSNIKIEANAQKELVKRLDNDLQRLGPELEKFRVLDRVVTIQDVKLLVSAALDDNVFELNKALVSRDAKRAFELYQGFLEMKMDPIALLGMVAFGLRQLFQVTLLLEKHLSNAEIASRLGISSYIVNITKKDRSASSEFVLGLLNKLGDLDQGMKLGKVDRYIAFELFMLEVIQS